MPTHDWNRVESGIFHAFHLSWIAELNKALNGGLLPQGFYALPEQHAGSVIPDVLTLHASPASADLFAPPPSTGGTALAEAPPKVQRKQTAGGFARARRRTLAIRHVSQHRLVAMLEIVSPANKDRAQSVADFARKAVDAVEYRIHVLMVDVLPPGGHDPCGMHGAIWQRLESNEEPYDLPASNSLTLASYVAADPVDVYLDHPSIGAALPDMPLFLSPERYVSVPLESTYMEAYRTMPAFWRERLEQIPAKLE